MRVQQSKRNLFCFGLISLILSKRGISFDMKANKNKTGLIFDNIFLHPIHDKAHPETPKRLQLAWEKIQSDPGFDNSIVYLPLKEISDEMITMIHSEDHLEKISSRYSSNIVTIAKSAVGGVIAACDYVHQNKIKNAFVAARPPGHHARNYGREEGFCFFNNIAIAARYLQNVLKYKRILIVDWDYHHGDGTEFFFYDDPTVLFFSLHDWHSYPGTGDPARKGEGEGYGYNINVHLNCGATDSDLRESLVNKLLPAAENFQPDFFLISAGFDSRKDDLLGCFNFSDSGFYDATKIVLDIAKKHANGKIVSLLEGGYYPEGVANGVQAHLTSLSDNKQ